MTSSAGDAHPPHPADEAVAAILEPLVALDASVPPAEQAVVLEGVLDGLRQRLGAAEA